MTNFSWLVDGSIVGVYLLATMVAGIMVRKYVGKVEHFLIAGREMDVYLGIASLAATEFGIVTCMYTAQLGYNHGFAGATPGICMAGAMLVVGLTGFCVKPLRDSGVMTIPELLERKYGPRIRWASGVVIVLGGLLNMGVFLRMGGDFLVYASGMDAGYLKITMTALLVAVAVYTILGGMLSVLVTDFLQFVVMSVGLIAVTALILAKIGWGTLADTVSRAYGEGGFNPFLNGKLGWEFVAFQTLHNLAAVLTWQTTIQRLLAAKDTATGRKIYTRTSFFFVCRFLIPGIWGIAALATLAPAAFAVLPEELLGQKSLYAMPLFLSTFVPVGLMGILVAAMLAADMSTDSSYMLTWGSVIYNDILAPFRKTKWSEKRGILWNRFIVAGIGIYLSSMSVLLVAACYWKRANSWGAAGAIIAGAVIPTAFLVLEQIPIEKLPEILADLRSRLGPSGSGLAAYVAVALSMVVGSLLKPPSRAAGEPEVSSHA
jgi:SSS family solute:Na+ symporter